MHVDAQPVTWDALHPIMFRELRVMPELIPFAFDEQLVRVVRRDDEPWFVGIDVCHCLGLAKPENALGSLDDDEKYTLSEGVFHDRRGPKVRIVVSEPGVYRLVFRSRKPEAERFKRWLAHEVLPALRRTGRYEAPTATVARTDPIPESQLHRLGLVREARMLFGADRARVLWSQLGLPPVPPPPATGLDEARGCLAYLLDHAGEITSGEAIRAVIEAAIDDRRGAASLALACGIKVDVDGGGFTVANAWPFLTGIYSRTQWAHGKWPRVLRRLPGCIAMSPQNFGNTKSRGTFVPLEYLDPNYGYREIVSLPLNND